MHILPILSSLRRHRTAAILIILQMALTCAIICNAVFLIGERLVRMNRPSGVAEDELVRVQLAGIRPSTSPEALTAEDLAALAAVPGVRMAAVSNQVPFGKSSLNSGLSVEPNSPVEIFKTAIYFGSEKLLETLGLRLVAGRDFLPEEWIDWEDTKDGKTAIPSVIISKAIAERVFPGESALGKPVYILDSEEPHRVVGVVERLVRPNDIFGADAYEFSSLLPIRAPYTTASNYVMRVDSDRRGEVLAAAVAALERNNPNRVVLEKQTLEDVRSDYYGLDRSMAWLLVSVCAALLIITALGIVGLASFWVQQRTRQIGIRRALGATRRQILRYFQTENFLLATMGIILGMALAYGINMLLMEKYELPRLPALVLPLGAVTLWLLGQFAVLGPALRAASVPPAVATRTV